MEDMTLPEEIRKVAMDFDNAVERKDIDFVLSSFVNNCEIELLGITLRGKGGVRKWINWLYENLAEIKLIPVIIMVDGNTFFEEFILKAKLHNGLEIESKQAEVLIYENYKIKSLRLYFDRLDFAESIKGFFAKKILGYVKKKSLEGFV
jgi:hypothetical protein